MANAALRMTGLKPFVQPGDRVRFNYYRVNTAASLFRFQPVAQNNSGQVQIATIGDLSPILGTVLGFVSATQDALPANLIDLAQNAFLDSSVNALAAVSDDPNQLYIMEADTGGTAIDSENSSGGTVTWTYMATTGNTTTGVSQALLDRSTWVFGTGGQLQLIRPYREYVNEDGTLNDVTLDNEKWIVRIYWHQRNNSDANILTRWPT